MARTSRAFWSGLLTKLTALVAACALWVYVDSVVMKTKTLEVKATVTREDGREVKPLSASAPTVRVTVRGPADAIQHITSASVACAGVVPNDYAGGPVTVQFTVDRVTFAHAPDLRALSISPAIARLEAPPASF